MANEPVQEIRLGRIRASIWAARTGEGVVHNVLLTRLHKTGRRWQEVARFGHDDLPLIRQVANLAHQWIVQQSPP
jgi:hypothetical protein